ncbi:MAG: hypothetical protein HYS26_03535 [Candidatus Kaiserbacteria bacterium]|nr:MAG: hypothetical protein HYS26_03535 [Candidatus Kaiserbacteria bacterium]
MTTRKFVAKYSVPLVIGMIMFFAFGIAAVSADTKGGTGVFISAMATPSYAVLPLQPPRPRASPPRPISVATPSTGT